MGQKADVCADHWHVWLWVGHHPACGWQWVAVEIDKYGREVGQIGRTAGSLEDARRKAEEFLRGIARGHYKIVWRDTPN